MIRKQYAHDRILQVAHTVADLDGSEMVAAKHMRRRFSIEVWTGITGAKGNTKSEY
jgi:hypothetical protein